MSETKQCPYCGGEILAVAKKCKHCGEWLENASRKERIDHLATPISKYVPLLVLIGAFALLISIAYDASGDYNPNIGSGKTRIINWVILQVRTYIPEWIGTFAGGVVESIFLCGLLIGLRGHSVPMKKSLIALIIPTALLSFSDAMNEDIFLCLGIISIVLYSIVAIRLLIHYEGLIAKWGKYTLYSISAMILGSTLTELWDGWFMLLALIIHWSIEFSILFKIWEGLLGEKEE